MFKYTMKTHMYIHQLLHICNSITFQEHYIHVHVLIESLASQISVFMQHSTCILLLQVSL